MNFKKKAIQLVIMLGLIFVGFGILETRTQASSWHKGIPSFMKNSFYRTKLYPKYFKINGKRYKLAYRNRYEGVKTYKNTMYFDGAQYGMTLKNCHYYRKGNYYVVKGKHTKYDTGYPAIKIKRISKKVIYANSGSIINSKPSFFNLEKMKKIK